MLVVNDLRELSVAAKRTGQVSGTVDEFAPEADDFDDFFGDSDEKNGEGNENIADTGNKEGKSGASDEEESDESTKVPTPFMLPFCFALLIFCITL